MIDYRLLKLDPKFTPQYREVDFRGQELKLVIHRYRGTFFSQFKVVYQMQLFSKETLVAELLTNGFVVRGHRGYLPLACTTNEQWRNQGLISYLIKQSREFFRSEGFLGFQVSIDKRNAASHAAANKVGFLEEPIPHEQFLNYILRF